MERRSKGTGATALSSAVYLGQNKLATIHRLLEAGAALHTLTSSGASYLMLACALSVACIVNYHILFTSQLLLIREGNGRKFANVLITFFYKVW